MVTTPAASRHPPNGQRRPRVVAHRGMPALLPELTLPGLRAAVAAGADVLEVDVLPSRDGLLVTRHEQQLDASTDGQGRLSDLTAAQLARLRAVERWPALRPSSARWDGVLRVPSLAEVLALVAGVQVGVAVELKDVAACAREGHDVVATLLRDLAAAGLPDPAHPVWVLAFEDAALARLAAGRRRGTVPPLRLVLLAETPDQWRLPRWAQPGDAVGPGLDLVLPAADAVRARVRQAHDAGIEVWCWTLVAEPALRPPVLAGATLADQVAEVCETGVDALVTDHADEVRRLLES